jgi:hypothetical protein
VREVNVRAPGRQGDQGDQGDHTPELIALPYFSDRFAFFAALTRSGWYTVLATGHTAPAQGTIPKTQPIAQISFRFTAG